MKCWNCNQHGHRKAECPEIRCFKCGRMGHMARNCTDSRPPRRRGGRLRFGSFSCPDPEPFHPLNRSQSQLCVSSPEHECAQLQTPVYQELDVYQPRQHQLRQREPRTALQTEKQEDSHLTRPTPQQLHLHQGQPSTGRETGEQRDTDLSRPIPQQRHVHQGQPSTAGHTENQQDADVASPTLQHRSSSSFDKMRNFWQEAAVQPKGPTARNCGDSPSPPPIPARQREPSTALQTGKQADTHLTRPTALRSTVSKSDTQLRASIEQPKVSFWFHRT